MEKIILIDFIDEEKSELRFHKTLYFLYGIYFKEKKEELYKKANFQAWKYGPVELTYRRDKQKFKNIF